MSVKVVEQKICMEGQRALGVLDGWAYASADQYRRSWSDWETERSALRVVRRRAQSDDAWSIVARIPLQRLASSCLRNGTRAHYAFSARYACIYALVFAELARVPSMSDRLASIRPIQLHAFRICLLTGRIDDVTCEASDRFLHDTYSLIFACVHCDRPQTLILSETPNGARFALFDTCYRYSTEGNHIMLPLRYSTLNVNFGKPCTMAKFVSDDPRSLNSLQQSPEITIAHDHILRPCCELKFSRHRPYSLACLAPASFNRRGEPNAWIHIDVFGVLHHWSEMNNAVVYYAPSRDTRTLIYGRVVFRLRVADVLADGTSRLQVEFGTLYDSQKCALYDLRLDEKEKRFSFDFIFETPKMDKLLKSVRGFKRCFAYQTELHVVGVYADDAFAPRVSHAVYSLHDVSTIEVMFRPKSLRDASRNAMHPKMLALANEYGV